MNCAVDTGQEQTFSREDRRWMQLACTYARRAQGSSWPNPAVGCALVSADNLLLATGQTQAGGRPHAEAAALAAVGQAGKAACLKKGTAYVTLEPCAHSGRGPACADLLVQSGIARVVYAVGDPDQRVNGQGHARLVSGGLCVQSGLCADEATDGLSGFLTSHRHARPYLISKIATSADGFISADIGQQTWLTNAASRSYVHDLRSRVDAVLTGIDTVLIDDPALTCRLSGGKGRTPVRVIFDSDLRFRSDCTLAKTIAAGPAVIFCGQTASLRAQTILEQQGIEVIRLARDAKGLDLVQGLQWCKERGLSTLLLEAGTSLNSSFYAAGLLDRIVHLSAQKFLKSGVPGLLYDASAATALAFVRDSAYIRVRSAALAGDRLMIWQKDKMNTGTQ